MKITINWLKKQNACREGVRWFGLKNRDVKEVLESLLSDYDPQNDELRHALKWANWLMVKKLTKKNNIRYAVFAAEQVLFLFEKKYPADKRPREAIEAAKKYINNPNDKNKKATAAYAAAAPKNNKARKEMAEKIIRYGMTLIDKREA